MTEVFEYRIEGDQIGSRDGKGKWFCQRRPLGFNSEADWEIWDTASTHAEAMAKNEADDLLRRHNVKISRR